MFRHSSEKAGDGTFLLCDWNAVQPVSVDVGQLDCDFVTLLAAVRRECDRKMPFTVRWLAV